MCLFTHNAKQLSQWGSSFFSASLDPHRDSWICTGRKAAPPQRWTFNIHLTGQHTLWVTFWCYTTVNPVMRSESGPAGRVLMVRVTVEVRCSFGVIWNRACYISFYAVPISSSFYQCWWVFESLEMRIFLLDNFGGFGFFLNYVRGTLKTQVLFSFFLNKGFSRVD